MKVAVVRTGTANLASVLAGLRRAGAEPMVTAAADVVAAADRVVLPGVGAFGAGMAALEAAGLSEALVERISAGRPTFAVCLGLQLLCASSDETPGVEGLGIVPAHVARFPDGVRVPHFGWNHVEPTAGCRVLQRGYAYFANSFRLPQLPEAWAGARCEHGGDFVAALERGAVVACQFHPELSGQWGAGLIERWLRC